MAVRVVIFWNTSLATSLSIDLSSPSAFLRPTSLQDLESFQTTIEVFEYGLSVAGKDADCVGYRPKISDEPLKFADHFAWRSYGEVDTRRKNLGSAIQGLFNSGDAFATDGLETVALWSMNIPGDFSFNPRSLRISGILMFCGETQNGGSLTLL